MKECEGIMWPCKLLRYVSTSVCKLMLTRITEGNSRIFNFLKPAGYVMHHQFNIQQLCVLPTLYLCVLYLSENKQRLVPLTA